MATNVVEQEIRRLLDIYSSTNELKKAGYLEPVLNIMRDPDVVKHIMTKYDMGWIIDDSKYNNMLNMWRTLLNKAQATQGINPDVVDALFAHIVDMTTVRPDKSDSSAKAVPITKSYTDNNDNVAAEPEVTYGTSVSYNSDDGWFSIRRGTRPKKGVPVLIAGWYYAGAVEQCIGVWNGNGQWELRVDNNNKPRFIPLLWKNLPDVPDYIMEEVPE